MFFFYQQRNPIYSITMHSFYPLPFLICHPRPSLFRTHIIGSKFPFIMKLCFSSSKSMNGAWNNAANEGMIEKENDGDIKVEIYN